MATLNAHLQPEPAVLALHQRPLPEIALALLDNLMLDLKDGSLAEMFRDLGNYLAPQELAEIYQILAEATSDKGRQRIGALAPMWVQYLRGGASVYHREQLFDGAVLYRSAVAAALRPSMVCFTSNLAGMFMANCRFLDLMGKHAVDVVLLTTDDGTFGDWRLGGAAGFQPSLQALTAALATRGIRPRLYVGASAGGAPSVFAAMMDGAAAALMLGGRFYAPGRNIPLAAAGPAFEPLCDCWAGPVVPVYGIYGADMPTDVRNAAKLGTLAPQARCYAIPKDNKHNPMAALGARQHLRPVIEQIVALASGKPVNFEFVVA